MKKIIALIAGLLVLAAAGWFVYDTVIKNNKNDISNGINGGTNNRDLEIPVYNGEFLSLDSEGGSDYPSVPCAYADVSQIMQLPELPTGCECISLTMVLRSLGFNVGKREIADRYLYKESMVRYGDGSLFGPDFRYTFAGDPSDESSFGCLAPCLEKTTNRYFSENSISDYGAEDITGTDFYSLFNYIADGYPVVIWATQGLKIPKKLITWETSDGSKVEWMSNEHCIVLSGYSYTDNTVRINDPLDGEQTLNMEKLKRCYDLMGQNALIIKKK